MVTYLHDDTGHDVLERLLELRQTREAGLNYSVGPLVHLGVLKSALLSRELLQFTVYLSCLGYSACKL